MAMAVTVRPNFRYMIVVATVEPTVASAADSAAAREEAVCRVSDLSIGSVVGLNVSNSQGHERPSAGYNRCWKVNCLKVGASMPRHVLNIDADFS